MSPDDVPNAYFDPFVSMLSGPAHVEMNADPSKNVRGYISPYTPKAGKYDKGVIKSDQPDLGIGAKSNEKKHIHLIVYNPNSWDWRKE